MKLESCMAISHILDNGIELADFQSIDLVRALFFKKVVFVYDTGIGKTVMAAGVIKALTNEAKNRRFIMVVEKSQLSQTPQKIKQWTGLNVLTSSATGEDLHRVFEAQDPLRYPILMITHDTLKSVNAMNALFKYKDAYFGIIVDEVHKLTNFTESQSASMLRALLRNFEYRYGLTATPVTSKPDQIVNLAHMFDPSKVERVHDTIVESKKGRSLTGDYPDLFFVRTRADLGISGNYRTHVEWVDPHEHQERAKGTDMFVTTRAEGAHNQASKVAELIHKHKIKGERGLIFVHHHKSREWLCKKLDEENIRYGCINGNVKSSDRDAIYAGFARGELDVVLTSVTTALDLDSEYIIFYEYTANIKQMLGRAERGLNPKTLDLYFIFTRNTGEVDYFLEKIYALSLWIQDVLKQDYSTLIRAGNMLKA